MQKVKKQMDFFLKKTVVKFASKSKKFANLAAINNICIVLENVVTNEASKSCSLKQK